MSALLAILLLAALPLPQEGDAARAGSSCTTACHGAETTSFAEGVHAGVLSCIDCHGGDPGAMRDKEAAHAAAAGFTGRVPRQQIPELCASCHADPKRMHAWALPTDQLVQYRSSRHGQALLEEGVEQAATCVDCHGSHGILPAADPRAPTAPHNQPATCGRCHADPDLMAPFGLPVDVVSRFEGSVHGVALLQEETRGAPACADCHGAHGATPPGAADIVQVCANCHPRTGANFRLSPHHGTDALSCGTCHEAEAELPGYRRSGCASCHGAHGIDHPGPSLYTGDQVGSCGHCHRTDDDAAEVAAAILEGRQHLQQAMEATVAEVERAQAAGLPLENESLLLAESRRALVALEPLTHSLDVATIRARVADGLERQEATRENMAKKQKVLRDRLILVGGLVLVLLMLAGLMGVKLGAVRRLS